MPGNPIVGMRLPAATITRLDQAAADHGLTRGQVVLLALSYLPGWSDIRVAAPQLPGQIALENVQQPQK